MKYVIGIDYGTDSCRAVIVNARNGIAIATDVQYYPRWMQGKYCDPISNQYRQHPLDYTETLETAVKNALRQAPAGTAEEVVGMAFDTTGSTPVLIDENGIPLALLPQFEDNPNAMFVLWKDHTAVKEAAIINQVAKNSPVDYTIYEGGIYSSEWVWAKVAHIMEVDPEVRSKAYSWVEHCDWITALVTGNTKPETLRRSRCAAGHKAMWAPDWDGLPTASFLTAVSPHLKGFREHLFSETYTSDIPAGTLSNEWAQKLGLSTNVAVAVGGFDCHFGAVGAEIQPHTFVSVVGTSTCDIMVADYQTMKNKLIPGICGQVDGSVIPGMVGLEAGQSAFGDLYAWFKNIVAYPTEKILAKSTLISEPTKSALINEILDSIIPQLSADAAQLPLSDKDVVATDWMNGRRTPDANQLLKGTITNLTLASNAPSIFKAIVEATAFGAKAIIDRFTENGIKIEQVIAIGGIPQKAPLVMQILADVLGMNIYVAEVEQACAFGAAMFAATAAGVYHTVQDAQIHMGQGVAKAYIPNQENHTVYKQLYQEYIRIGQQT